MKLDVNGKNKISLLQGGKLHWACSFLMAQIKRLVFGLVLLLAASVADLHRKILDAPLRVQILSIS